MFSVTFGADPITTNRHNVISLFLKMFRIEAHLKIDSGI
jgi:hypothetical protein